MRSSKLNIAQRIILESLWLLMRLFAILPYWFKYYVVQNIIFFVLFYCMRYRLKVVNENLRNSFPEKSESELKVIRLGFYHTLSEMFVNTINLSGMSGRKALRFSDVEDVENHRQQVFGRNWIAMLAHFGCWEYGSFWGLYDPTQVITAVYHPLRNKIMEELFLRFRHHENAIPIPMADCLRFYMRHCETGFEGKNIVMGLAADQNPPRRPNSHWFRFLNQDTLFFDGAEKLSLRFHMPVYFVNVVRLKPGYYQMRFDMIYDGVEEVAPNEITERYVRRLETMICEHPELWMWSHRRWKHKRPNGNN